MSPKSVETAFGLATLILAITAFFLPDMSWLPRAALVGWLLLIAGFVEVFFSLRQDLNGLRKAALISGLITAAAGLLFVLNPSARYFPVANIVMAWLFVRGAWVTLTCILLRNAPITMWFGLSGLADLLLGLALLSHLPLTALVYLMFGATEEIVARFSLVLVVSFLMTGVSQLAIACSHPGHARGVD